MTTLRKRLPDVWREASRPGTIEEATRRIAALVDPVIPFDTLFVISLEPNRISNEGPHVEAETRRQRLELRAIAPGAASDPEMSTGRTLSLKEMARIRSWGKRGEIVTDGSGGDGSGVLRLLTSILPNRPAEGAWLAGPIRDGVGVAGALLMHARIPYDFTAMQAREVDALLEPFSTLLQNDRRLRELDALREAAQSEQRAILARTGRDDSVDTIIGTHGGLRPVMERVALVATSDVPVLILGETGSGKEVIARAIHERSPRAGKPFIRVNCGAIPPELVDSELFGHEKGAFTGAVATRRGWFERADGGTLLLDEIGELPLPAQVRLLRVLQEGTFERVGGEVPIRVDVRMVAATHRDLPTMIRKGRFREDLWYRIASFPILLPPLRERREDIPELTGHFVDRAARRFGLRPLTLKPSDLELLTNYEWPGNIRELASIIDRAAILGAGETLEVAKALGSTLHTGTPGGEVLADPLEGASDVSMLAQVRETRGMSDSVPTNAGQATDAGLVMDAGLPSSPAMRAATPGAPGRTSGPPASEALREAPGEASSGAPGDPLPGTRDTSDLRGAERGSMSVAPPPGEDFLDLDEAMRLHIERALARTRGQIEGDGGAARLLQINPHTLRARMRKLDIDWTRYRNGVG